jgi:hypothetical protein
VKTRVFLLIATIIFGGAIAFFAIQNAGPIDLHVNGFHLTTPLYWVVLGSVLLTLIFSWIVSLFNTISSSFLLHGRDNTVKQLKKENADLTKKLHQLEIDNARTTGEQKNKPTSTQ